MDKLPNPSRAIRIGVLPLPGFALMSYASTVEPYRAANLLSGRALYEVTVIGGADQMIGNMIASSGQGGVVPVATVGQALSLDYLFVVAGGDPASVNDPGLFRWLARMARSGAILGGVSGGPVVLARAELMEGRRMTVHWEHAEALAEVSPNLMIDRTLYVIDRDRVTCAGGTAPMDLMHALIAQDHGAPFAQAVSDWFLHTDVRPSGGPQRGGLVARVGTTNAAVLDAVAAMESHVADPLSLGDLAAFAGVSARQLMRLFQAKLGQSAMGYYRDLRLDKAQNLMRNSALPLTEIALATGFANSSHFSRSYAARFGAAPSTFRV